MVPPPPPPPSYGHVDPVDPFDSALIVMVIIFFIVYTIASCCDLLAQRRARIQARQTTTSSRTLEPRSVVIDIQPARAVTEAGAERQAPQTTTSSRTLEPRSVVIDIQPARAAPTTAPANVSNLVVPNRTHTNIQPSAPMYNDTSIPASSPSLSGNSLAEPNNCPICLDGLEQGPEVMALRLCKHSFHKECIDQWMKSKAGDHKKCPICRTLIYV